MHDDDFFYGMMQGETPGSILYNDPSQARAEREILAAPGAARCDVAVITGAKLLRNGLENVTFTRRPD